LLPLFTIAIIILCTAHCIARLSIELRRNKETGLASGYKQYQSYMIVISQFRVGQLTGFYFLFARTICANRTKGRANTKKGGGGGGGRPAGGRSIRPAMSQIDT